MKLFYKLVIMFVAIVAMNMWQASSANAAECKGVSRAACKSSASCYWVKGFSRKDGVTVKSHCRSKAKGKHAKRREAIKKNLGKKKAKIKSKLSDRKKEIKEKRADKKERIKEHRSKKKVKVRSKRAKKVESKKHKVKSKSK